MNGIVPEAKVLLRMAIFGIVTGCGYWFLTYEIAGSILLVAFGGASGLGAIGLQVGWRQARPATEPRADPDSAATIATPEGAAPHPGWAPLGIAAGVGFVALGATFGPWLTLTGILAGIVGGVSWLSAAMLEAEDDPTAGASAARRIDRSA